MSDKTNQVTRAELFTAIGELEYEIVQKQKEVDRILGGLGEPPKYFKSKDNPYTLKITVTPLEGEDDEE